MIQNKKKYFDGKNSFIAVNNAFIDFNVFEKISLRHVTERDAVTQPLRFCF